MFICYQTVFWLVINLSDNDKLKQSRMHFLINLHLLIYIDPDLTPVLSECLRSFHKCTSQNCVVKRWYFLDKFHWSILISRYLLVINKNSKNFVNHSSHQTWKEFSFPLWMSYSPISLYMLILPIKFQIFRKINNQRK